MITMTTGRRYPLTPLLQAADLSRRQLQTELGISWTRLQELERDGLTDEAADRYAIRLHLWPWNIWPTWLTDGLTAIEGVAPDRSSSEQP